jgi:methyl coenzyme M reductase gamma subunit
MQVTDVTDADRAYLERVADDCRRILGPEIELRKLELATNDEVVLRLGYRLDDSDWLSEGRGETVVAAHSALREGLVLDRIRLGVRALYRGRR